MRLRAVAFPHAAKVEAQRYVGEQPKSQARAGSVAVLRVVGGKQPYEAWAARLRVEPLPTRDAILLSPG